MLIKGVIFDLDDTLISEREYIKSGFKSVANKISNDYKKNECKIYEVLYSEFEIDSKNVFNRVLDKLSLEYDKSYILELINTYRSHIPNIKLYDDAIYIIKELYNKDIKLGIITDGYAITQRNKLQVLDIDKYFEYIIVTDELGREFWKPHKKSYEMMKNNLGLEYEELVYIGDNITKDFITPNQLGMNTIMIERKEGIYSNIKTDIEYRADITINRLDELVNILNTIEAS